ncbi:MAG: hypothetical protein KIT43_13320 [Bauldia sp.]|nr:hypothetical protein [Bauldia sp.]
MAVPRIALALAAMALNSVSSAAAAVPLAAPTMRGAPEAGRIEVAQFLGDELACAFTPNDDICILNALRPVIEGAPAGEADSIWAEWYQATLVARDELLFVPRPADIADFVGSDEFYRAIVAARLAFEGDFVEAERAAVGIVDAEAAARAYLSIAAAQEKAGRTVEALAALATAAERLAAMEPRETFVLSDELARAYGRLGDAAAAAVVVDAGLAANEALGIPEIVKRINRIGFAGGVCAARGSAEGLALVADGLAALGEIPAAAIPPVVRGTAHALAARGYGQCGRPDEANRAAEAARAVARDEVTTGRDRALILHNLLGTVP